MSLSAKRIGEIGLHILSFEEMSREDWLSFFKNISEVDYAIDDKEGFIARSPANKEEIYQVLSDHKQVLLEGAPQKNPEQVVVSQEAVHRGTTSAPRHIAPNVVHAVDAHIQNRIETIITDKGVFFHIDALRERLKAFTEDEKLFMKACANAGVDIFTEYVSEAAKKKIATAVQELTKDGNDK